MERVVKSEIKFGLLLICARGTYVIEQTGRPREFLDPRAKGNLTPSSNSPNNDTQTKSTMVCQKQGISTTKLN
jgi:hypothetical protein